MKDAHFYIPQFVMKTIVKILPDWEQNLVLDLTLIYYVISRKE